MTIISSSWEQTFEAGKALAEKLTPGDVLAFHGDLGAGKTVFIRGLAEGLGLDARVTSPTFTIVNEYGGKIPLFHFDMYRLSGSDELFEIGWEDYLARGGICAVEWSEITEDAFPENTINIYIKKIDDNSREITIDIPEES
ncbi:MAG: tRNA (adenosine(37)-N6)-threonylcarbamoyltransferase complex ATPase subunit type 1 TsaE [Oscillospiraceae bacterium]|nr:tRNA (adenosine(37)-N6)-threonylcarbamoyltransferase complex ATPase subunit type 1 TsaE [Oscillospiraceae bacterium]